MRQVSTFTVRIRLLQRVDITLHSSPDSAVSPSSYHIKCFVLAHHSFMLQKYPVKPNHQFQSFLGRRRLFIHLVTCRSIISDKAGTFESQLFACDLPEEGQWPRCRPSSTYTHPIASIAAPNSEIYPETDWGSAAVGSPCDVDAGRLRARRETES